MISYGYSYIDLQAMQDRKRPRLFLKGNIFDKIDKKSFIDYVIFCSVLNILAIIVNSIPIYIHVDNVPTSGYNYPYPYYTNFMFLKRAGNIPVKILCDISDKVPVIFTILMFIICIFGTYFLIWLVVTIIEKIRGKKAYGENNPN